MTDLQHWHKEHLSTGTWLLIASPFSEQLISALIQRCPPPPYLWGPGRARELHEGIVSVCLSCHFNCYISSALIWAKREASAEPGTSKATSPSLTSCLSLWRSPGFGEPEKGDWRGGVDSRLEWVWWANCSPQWTQAHITEGRQRLEQKLWGGAAVAGRNSC